MEFLSLSLSQTTKDDDDDDEFSLLEFYSSSFSIHMRVLVYDCDCALLLKYRILEMFNLSLFLVLMAAVSLQHDDYMMMFDD